MKTAGAILVLLAVSGAAFFHFVLERAASAKDASGLYPEIYGYVSYFRMPVYSLAGIIAFSGLTLLALGTFRTR